MFINLTNHNSEQWSAEQLRAAWVYGKIVDIPFPNIPADALAKDVKELTEEYCRKVLALNPLCVLVQGEMVFTYAMVQMLKKKGIRVVAATTERLVKEVEEEGVIVKKSVFQFKQFREYI